MKGSSLDHGGSGDGSDAALRALRSASDEIAALRARTLAPDVARGYVLRVANAVDRCLRRLLRDDERADLEVRLKALAPDEIGSNEVLAELRRNERLPMDLAAAVHDLFDVRRRLEGGESPTSQEGGRAAEVAERLERVIDSLLVPVPAFVAESPLPEAKPEGALGPDDMPEPRVGRRRRRGPSAPLGALVAIALIGLAVVFGTRALGGRGPDQMDQGIALFRSGAYADAAQHFWRYAEANPGDATPHLYLARIHRRMGRPELAAEAIREAQQRAPGDAAVHRELGFLLLDTGQPDAAVERFREALTLDPESSEGWVGLVRGLRESGRGDEVPAALAGAPAEARALLDRAGVM